MHSFSFDKSLFNLTRLQIIAELVDCETSYCELKSLLKLTDGNLESHLISLEKHGLIKKERMFEERKTKTKISLTEKGKGDFENLKQWFFEQFLEGN